MKKLLFFFLFLSFFACSSKSGNRKTETQKVEITNKDQTLKVTKVVDGDTFWVDDGSEKGIKIRLIGIDAPESRNVFKKKKGYYGKEAKVYLTNLLKGQRVKLEFDVDQFDQYGRTLAYAYLLDGTFINANLVKNGFATVMTIQPNVKYADLFVKYQQEARKNNRGLWKMKK